MTTMARPQTIRQLLEVASAWLTSQGVDEARLDTELLLARVLGCRRLDLYLDHDRPLIPDELERFRALMRRRGAREPVAYILGERGFYGETFEVGPGVLVPRPETEHLVEVGLEELDRLSEAAGGSTTLRAADVGTGSGCVAVSLAKERPTLRVLALDVSPAALNVAARNARKLEVHERVSFARADLLAAAGEGTLDLVVSNPPYITPDEEGLLAPEVARFEPRSALFDAPGLPLTRRLAVEARRALRPGGAVAIETGWDKADLVADQLTEAGFEGVRRVPDLARIERIVVGRVPA